MQSASVALDVGADIAKDEIVVACADATFAPRKIENRRAALLAFLNGLHAGSRIGIESTGSYHELLAELAHKLGFLVFVLNPRDTRHYAKAMGLRGKTDRVDAQLIARISRASTRSFTRGSHRLPSRASSTACSSAAPR